MILTFHSTYFHQSVVGSETFNEINKFCKELNLQNGNNHTVKVSKTL